MDCLIDIAAARALVADAALWPRVRDFLWDFAPLIHPSWIDELECLKVEGASPQTLKLSNSQTFKRFILSTLGIPPCFHAFPKDDWSRLVLLDGQTLELIVKWLGALACAEGLRRVTDGKTVRELRALLPGVYPEVFGFTIYFKGMGISRGDDSRGDAEKPEEGNQDVGRRPSIVEDVVPAGLSIVGSLLVRLPEPLVTRFKFKLPKAFCDSVSLRETEKHSADAGAALTKLLKLKFPEAYRLCC